jgi:hypothetical protein
VYGIASIVEKARGAKAAGATTIICPEENAKELKVCVNTMFIILCYTMIIILYIFAPLPDVCHVCDV